MRLASEEGLLQAYLHFLIEKLLLSQAAQRMYCRSLHSEVNKEPQRFLAGAFTFVEMVGETRLAVLDAGSTPLRHLQTFFSIKSIGLSFQS